MSLTAICISIKALDLDHAVNDKPINDSTPVIILISPVGTRSPKPNIQNELERGELMPIPFISRNRFSVDLFLVKRQNVPLGINTKEVME